VTGDPVAVCFGLLIPLLSVDSNRGASSLLNVPDGRIRVLLLRWREHGTTTAIGS
jgi:hypothetical protein